MGMGEKSWRRKEIRRVLFLLRRVRDRGFGTFVEENQGALSIASFS